MEFLQAIRAADEFMENASVVHPAGIVLSYGVEQSAQCQWTRVQVAHVHWWTEDTRSFYVRANASASKNRSASFEKWRFGKDWF